VGLGLRAMEDLVKSFGGIYSGKRVLLTGHTGFKGGWLALWLRELGATVCGYSLAPEGDATLFELLPDHLFADSRIADVRETEGMRRAIRDCRPDVIFHLAAQAIVGVSYRDPLDTFTSNALGTAVLLESVRAETCGAAVVIVTSDKCYRNDNTGRAFVETDPLGGNDVYSMSKAAAELVTASWHASFFSKDDSLGPLGTGRAGNVIGGGDYAEDRIVPDAVRAHQSGGALVLRNPGATRPWQHVLESVSGYLALGHRLLSRPEKDKLLNYNFGPNPESVRSVQDLVDTWLQIWPDAFPVEKLGHTAYDEAARLSLDPEKAKQDLGWIPVWGFEKTVARTADWYRLRHEDCADDMTMLSFSREQILSYSHEAHRNSNSWAE